MKDSDMGQLTLNAVTHRSPPKFQRGNAGSLYGEDGIGQGPVR